MYDDLPSRRKVGMGIVGWSVTIILAFFVVGLVVTGLKWVMAPVNMATGIVERVINADHALESYRWFHSANQQVKAKQGQIVLSKAALEAAAADRKEARRVELLGLQQNCQTLVADYNARAMRADTVIFLHPERFLPGNWPGDRNPLPQSIDLGVCS